MRQSRALIQGLGMQDWRQLRNKKPLWCFTHKRRVQWIDINSPCSHYAKDELNEASRMDMDRPMAPQVTQVGPSGPVWGGGHGQLEANAGSWPVRGEPWMESRGEEKRHQE